MSSLREQAEAARYEADREKQRRSMEEFYHHKEENTNLGEDFQKNLSFKTISNQDWRTIIRQECESKRHKVFYEGTPAEKRALSQNNHTHILSIQQIKCIVEQLKRWGSYEDQEYLDQVSIPHSIVAIYANYHKMTYEEANERVSATFVNDSEGLEAEGESEAEEDATKLAREETKRKKKDGARKKKQTKAEEKEKQLKSGQKKVFKVFKEEERKKKQKKAGEKEKQPKAAEKKVFKFNLEEEKKTIEEERAKPEKKVVSKKQKSKTVKSTIEGRRAEEERCQPRRLEPEQPANLPLSESAILGRGDAVASVFVDYVLGIRSSKTHNP